MKKNRYDVETLTEALHVLNRFESGSHKPDDYYRDEIRICLALSNFMTIIKNYLSGVSLPLERQKKIEVFEILTEISFDKLEKDVMGVN